MTDKIPPVPPANRNPKDAGEHGRKAAEAEALRKPSAKEAEQRGRSGNVKQNTTNQGLQQDR